MSDWPDESEAAYQIVLVSIPCRARWYHTPATIATGMNELIVMSVSLNQYTLLIEISHVAMNWDKMN